MPDQFHTHNFISLCDTIRRHDKELAQVIEKYGYPPMWTRPPDFASLVHIILEQQVSLASAKAAFLKLKKKLGKITPSKVLILSDEELKSCYFSRQKIVYVRALAEAIVSKKLVLKELALLPDDEVRTQLKQVKGIGDWTADVYLIFALQRTDIFPSGDLAMINAFREIKKLKDGTSKEEIIHLANSWRPNRTLATMILWHHYIQKRNLKF